MAELSAAPEVRAAKGRVVIDPELVTLARQHPTLAAIAVAAIVVSVFAIFAGIAELLVSRGSRG